MKHYIRKGSERGYFDFGWLKTYHSFSFGEYHDPNHMSFGPLRVINHDFIKEGMGFPKHPHRDMEIITYVLKGTVEHEDSLGNKEQIKNGQIQVMTAGTGIVHSEYNPSKTEELELLQIWLMPNKRGSNPNYKTKQFTDMGNKNKFVLIASPDGKNNSMQIQQNVNLYSLSIENSSSVKFESNYGNKIWIQIAQGDLEINVNNANKFHLVKGDGLAIELESAQSENLKFDFTGKQASELLLFEMSSH